MSPLPFTAEILHAFVPLQLRVIPQTLPPHFATYLHAPLPWHESSIPSMLPGAVPSSFPFAMSLHALAPTQPRTTKKTTLRVRRRRCTHIFAAAAPHSRPADVRVLTRVHAAITCTPLESPESEPEIIKWERVRIRLVVP